MNDREKMLAEGPRVAPEPRSVDGYEPPVLVGDEPVVLAGDAAGTAKPARARRLGRLLPLGIPLAFVLANVAGFGEYVGLIVIAGAVAAVLVEAVVDLVRR